MAINPYNVELLFANNAQTTLAGSIGPSTTTLNVQAGGGALFPNPSPGQGFAASLTDAATGLLREVVLVTQRSGDTMTVVRGQEGFTPISWSANDLFSQLNTAGDMASMVQVKQAQASAWTYGDDVGSTNALLVVFDPAIVAPVAGTLLRVKVLNGNTGAATLDFGTGPLAIVRRDGSALIGNELVAGQVALFSIQPSNVQLLQPGPASSAALSAGTDTQSFVTPQQLAGTGFAFTGMITFGANVLTPAGWLKAFGQQVARVGTYANLFAAITRAAVCTITIANPAVVTQLNHGLAPGDVVSFETTGSLPTGISVGVNYYVMSAGFTVNTFQISTSPTGGAVVTSGGQAGVQTLRYNPFGCGDGSTTFTLPDTAGRSLFGADNLSGTFAGRIGNQGGGTPNAAGVNRPGTIGASGGAQTASYTYSGTTGTTSAGGQVASTPASVDWVPPTHTHNYSGTTDVGNNTSPMLGMNCYIKI